MPDEPTEATPSETALNEIAESLEAERLDEALARLTALHPADQALVIDELESGQRPALLARMSHEALAHMIGYLGEESRRTIASELEPSAIGPVLDLVDRDVAADVLRALPPEQARAALAVMRRAAGVVPLLPHPDETAGGRMTSDFVALHKEWTVEEALSYLRRMKPAAEQVFYLYVVDDAHRLEGVVSLRHLVVANPERRIGELMTPEVVSVRTGQDQEEVARQVQHYNFIAVPVVDEDRHLVGVVSVDDLMDVAQEEATEDMFLMAGLSEEESVYRPLAQSVAPRMSWLIVNLLTASAAAGVVSAFEGTIERAAALAVFMPVIAGMGGNAGIQTITLVVRSMALGEVALADVRYVLRRELAIGLANGVVIGLLLGIVVYAWKQNAGLSAVAGVAMLLNMATAVTVGVLVPLTLRALRLDPALASGVFVTMFTDIMGFFFFLGLATLLIDQIA
jgi:magnesium transporter